MNKLTPFAIAATLALAACGDDAPSTPTATAPAATTTVTTTTGTTATGTTAAGTARTEAQEAVNAIGRRSRDGPGDRRGRQRGARRRRPALERAQQATGQAIESARQGLNNLTRDAACQTARAANDTQGVAANADANARLPRESRIGFAARQCDRQGPMARPVHGMRHGAAVSPPAVPRSSRAPWPPAPRIRRGLAMRSMFSPRNSPRTEADSA